MFTDENLNGFFGQLLHPNHHSQGFMKLYLFMIHTFEVASPQIDKIGHRLHGTMQALLTL